MLMAVPHSVAAQGSCTGADDPGTPPVLTLASANTYTSNILCTGLTGGLTLNFNGAQIGQSASMITGPAFNINAIGNGNSEIAAMGRVTIYSQDTGIRMFRDGTGSLKLELEEKSVIHASGKDDSEEYGIHLEHRGEDNTALDDDSGINLVSNAKIVLSGKKTQSIAGVYVRTNSPKPGTTIPIKIHLAGGSIRTEIADKQRGQGISAGQFAKGDITITVAPGVKIGTKDNPIGAFGISAAIESTGVGNIRIEHLGEIYAINGLNAYIASGSKIKGNIVIETGAGSKIVTHLTGESSDTTYDADTTYRASGTYPYGISAFIKGDDRDGTVTITHKGMIDAAGPGIETYGNRAVTVTLERGSSIKAKEIGIKARTKATGIVTVKTEAGSTVTAERHGIQVDQRGPEMRKFDVTVHGTVMGGNVDDDGNKYAGVHIRKKDQTVANKIGGGTLVIGPQARVEATSGVAIQVDAKAGDVEVILEQDEAGLMGHVKGQILNPAAEGDSDGTTRSKIEFKIRSVSGSETVLKSGAIFYRRGERTGVYEEVIKTELKTIEGEGFKFEDDTTVSGLRLYSHRSRLYEVLPSVLLGLVELTPYSTRMAVPRRTTGDEEVMVQSSKGEHVAVPGARTGVWVRLAVRDGERMADTSTTATDFRRQSLAWDVKQTDFEAGLEVPTDERLVLGVSAHSRQSKATVKRGGTMEASGTGVGVSLTWTDDSGLYVDGQLSYTRFFDVALTSSRNGQITSKGGGSGLALGVEVGRPMSIGGMAVIPRGGLSWSSVDMDAFDEPTTIDGAGRVAPDKEQSVQGRVGVLAELGPKDADRRLYASLDLEHEFSSKHAVMVAGTRLATEVKPTWVRLGVGGAMSLGSGDTTQLTGDAFYATAGSDNTDFGGGLSVTFRF